MASPSTKKCAYVTLLPEQVCTESNVLSYSSILRHSSSPTELRSPPVSFQLQFFMQTVLYFKLNAGTKSLLGFFVCFPVSCSLLVLNVSTVAVAQVWLPYFNTNFEPHRSPHEPYLSPKRSVVPGESYPMASPFISMAVARLVQDAQNYVAHIMAFKLMGTPFTCSRYAMKLITLKS